MIHKGFSNQNKGLHKGFSNLHTSNYIGAYTIIYRTKTPRYFKKLQQNITYERLETVHCSD